MNAIAKAKDELHDAFLDLVEMGARRAELDAVQSALDVLARYERCPHHLEALRGMPCNDWHGMAAASCFA